MNVRVFLFLLLLSAPVASVFPAPPAVFAEEEVDEEKVDELEGDIDDVSDELEEEQATLAALSSELAGIARSISSVAAAISETEDALDETEETIGRKEAEIDHLERDADRNREILSGLIREAYYREEQFSLPEILSEEDVFRALNDPERLMSVGERIRDILVRVRLLREKIETEKAELEGVKEEKEALLEMKEAQKNQLAREHASTKSDLVEQQATVAELQAELSKLRTALSGLLGEAYDTDDILDAAKFASKATGVRKDFILGMLVVETNLGRYTGGCTYKESKMGDANLKIFKRVADDLDYNYKKLKVSCPLSYGIGGAMGVAQFMPTTWAGYESRIAEATGHEPPDPWSLVDGVTAMAIKLANDGATKKSGEFDAARRYYCGSRLDRDVCISYGNKVLYWAKNYENLL